MTTGVVLFTRDLRVRDHPALWEAARTFDRVVPLFVFDPVLLGGTSASANRTSFLLQAVEDLDRSLAKLGAGLVWRAGEPVAEVMRVAREANAKAIWMSADVSAYAQARANRLRRAAVEGGVDLRFFPGTTVVPPGAVVPAGGSHFRIFTPYHQAWRARSWRAVLPAPMRLAGVDGLPSGSKPPSPAGTSPHLPPGGETTGRRRMEGWLESGLSRYAELHDQLGRDATSRLSPYLHFGCLSALELATRAARIGAESFVRQLCWRDFNHQVLHAVPQASRQDYRPGRSWLHDDRALNRWRQGRTGVPIVDAAMRQLADEGWMHNRGRLLVASFLTKHLGIDWRDGAAHFLDLLVDGDLANNSMNWQWVAGTGNDTRPNRIFNPTRQAERFDPAGDYVRRYLPELAAVEGPAVHQPWKLEPLLRRSLDYPAPMVDLAQAAAGFRARGGSLRTYPAGEADPRRP